MLGQLLNPVLQTPQAPSDCRTRSVETNPSLPPTRCTLSCFTSTCCTLEPSHLPPAAPGDSRHQATHPPSSQSPSHQPFLRELSRTRTNSNRVLTTCQIVNQGFHVHLTVQSFKRINKTTTHTFPKGQAGSPATVTPGCFQKLSELFLELGRGFSTMFSQARSLQSLLLNGVLSAL